MLEEVVIIDDDETPDIENELVAFVFKNEVEYVTVSKAREIANALKITIAIKEGKDVVRIGQD